MDFMTVYELPGSELTLIQESGQWELKAKGSEEAEARAKREAEAHAKRRRGLLSLFKH